MHRYTHLIYLEYDIYFLQLTANTERELELFFSFSLLFQPFSPVREHVHKELQALSMGGA